MVVGRYAPSPTGPLHHGNLRTALLAWLQVRLKGGSFLLRIDDLDQARNQAGATERLLDDLQWLGIDWQGEPYFQSRHLAEYEIAFESLKRDNLIFPCRCSRKDIAIAASAPHDSDQVSVYPGTCRPESGVMRPERLSQYAEMKPTEVAWRFQVADQIISFTDLLLGKQNINLSTTVGDFVIKRKDGVFAYQLATVVDDALMGITDVLRGDDLLDSTPRQLALADVLGYNRPNYWHVPLMQDASGQRMSKRGESETLESWRKSGKSSSAYIGFLAHSLNLVETTEPISCERLASSLTLDSLRQKLRPRC